MSARTNQLLEAGLWLKMSGDVEGARRLFEQALRLDPESIRARELLGHSVPEAEAVPQELRDVPVTRSDLFSVPLPRLFQDEPPAPASMPEEWWNAPPSDAMGNTSRFFVRTAEPAGSGGAPAPMHTIPWGPSPLPPRAAGSPAESPRAASPAHDQDFQGDDLGESGDDFGLELMEGTPARQGRSGAEAVPSRTTGAIPLPSALGPGATGPVLGPPPPAPAREPTPAEGSVPPRTTGPVPLPPAVAPLHATPAPATPSRARVAGPDATAEPSRTTGPVPLPAARAQSAPAAPDPSPPQEPVPWSMPASGGSAPATTPSKGVGAIPLPPAGPGRGQATPRAAAPPPTTTASFGAVSPAAGGHPFPSDAWGGEGEGPTLLAPEGPGALELLAEPRGVSGLTPLPAPRDPRSEAVRLFERSRELQNLDDHSGARELLLQAQSLHPELTGLADALARSETKLQTIYESKLGKLSAVPRVRLKEDEVIWLNLDHRAGFMLAQIDGTLSFEDLFSVSGMSRLDTARILAQLLDQRVIVS